MVVQQVILLGGMGIIGFVVGLVAKNNDQNESKKQPRSKSRKARAVVFQDEQEELEPEVQHGQRSHKRPYSSSSRRSNAGNVNEHDNVQFRKTSTNHFMAQQTVEYQVAGSPKKADKTKGKKQGIPVRHSHSSATSATVSLKGASGSTGRDPLVDTLFKEIELLIKEKANMQGEIEELRLKVHQLGELVTYLQIERDQEGETPETIAESEAPQELPQELSQWMSAGASTSTEQEMMFVTSPNCHDDFYPTAQQQTDALLNHHSKLLIPNKYETM
eukprot:TRINITY_DN2108_c0_g2_i1.p3 TRINITY_DN2108_c0_g2~~TRINITY_DN2108_c0_g2_i1.p3  ORF type:complete len:294 (+),score=33.60 TRINITY_DN2108_c0_g2_i1:62-883(+)